MPTAKPSVQEFIDSMSYPDLMVDGRIIDIRSWPSYWLVLTVPWPDDVSVDREADCAVALAPELLDWRSLTPMAGRLARFADVFMRGGDEEIIFIADLTRTLKSNSADWSDLNIDLLKAGYELLRQPNAAAMPIRLGKNALCTLEMARAGVEPMSFDGSDVLEPLRTSLTSLVKAEWPKLVTTRVWERAAPIDLLDHPLSAFHRPSPDQARELWGSAPGFG